MIASSPADGDRGGSSERACAYSRLASSSRRALWNSTPRACASAAVPDGGRAGDCAPAAQTGGNRGSQEYNPPHDTWLLDILEAPNSGQIRERSSGLQDVSPRGAGQNQHSPSEAEPPFMLPFRGGASLARSLARSRTSSRPARCARCWPSGSARSRSIPAEYSAARSSRG